jgi:inner membrane protein
MSTIYTHAVVGLGLGRIFARRKMPWLFWGLAALLPVVPDFDAFLVGVPYRSPWGHRGFTHSLLFALVLGLLAAALTYRRLGISFLDLAGFFFVITASHGVLDALNNGGEGVEFFWPFDTTRYGTWAGAPLHYPDIGFELPDPRKSLAIQSEQRWVWLPMALVVGAVMLYRRLRPGRSSCPDARRQVS